VGLLHGGVRAELVEAAGWGAEVETTVDLAVTEPETPGGSSGPWRWQNFEGGRWFGAVAGGVQWAPEKTHLKLEAGGVYFTGPSYVVMPRVEWEVVPTLSFELGAAFIGGKAPPLVGGVPPLNAPMVPIGWMYTNVDQVFVGARWSL
jgi:hypothetical protein